MMLIHKSIFISATDTISFFQAEDGIRDAQESRGLGDVYKRQGLASDSMARMRIF